jgi:hypothetical protein
MKKKNQPFDSVNTSGLLFETKQEQVPVAVTPEVEVAVAVVDVEVKEEPVVIEKAEIKKAPKKKETEDEDVVPMSTINKVSDLNES